MDQARSRSAGPATRRGGVEPRLRQAPAPAVSSRVVTGIQPTGGLHLGNLFGALLPLAQLQEGMETFLAVADLHALTVPRDPTALRSETLSSVALCLAAGIDPRRTVLFVQSHVPQHPLLGWLLACLARPGELERMTQFKEKGRGGAAASFGLLAYPALMAADVLLYKPSSVPVGDDQRQHLELTRTLARRFNAVYGQTFPLPATLTSAGGARVMSLDDPARKMSKSAANAQGRISLLDPPAVIRDKIRGAATDSGGEVRFDPAAKPGVSNLLMLYGLFSGETPEVVAQRYTRYDRLKGDLAELIAAGLEPIRRRYEELLADPGFTARVLARGARRAAAVAEGTMQEVRERVGLLPRPGAAGRSTTARGA